MSDDASPSRARQVVPCQGAPRDLGFDQGSAQVLAIRRETHRIPGRLARWRAGRDPRVRAVERDVARYFPHLSERSAGLARGAGVTRADLARLLTRELRIGTDVDRRAGAGVLVGVAGDRTGGSPIVARSVELADGVGLIERRSTPEHDYRSREWVVPWLVAPLAGVNEHGLMVAVHGAEPVAAPRGCCAPAVLLGQDCLQRFDRVERAVEWCERRPAGGRAAILLADASGDLALVELADGQRTVTRPAQGLCIGPCDPGRRQELEKTLLAGPRCSRAGLHGLLGAGAIVLESGDASD